MRSGRHPFFIPCFYLLLWPQQADLMRNETTEDFRKTRTELDIWGTVEPDQVEEQELDDLTMPPEVSLCFFLLI